MITLSEAVRLFGLSDDDYICMFPKGSNIDWDYFWLKVRTVRKRFYMRKTMVHAIRETAGTGSQGAEIRVMAFEISAEFKPRGRGRNHES